MKSAEKDALIKTLKDKVKGLEDMLGMNKKAGKPTEAAFGAIVENGQYILVELLYDPETGDSKIVNKKVVGNSISRLEYEIKKELVDKLFLPLRRR